jgi:hypothetical protein
MARSEDVTSDDNDSIVLIGHPVLHDLMGRDIVIISSLKSTNTLVHPSESRDDVKP